MKSWKCQKKKWRKNLNCNGISQLFCKKGDKILQKCWIILKPFFETLKEIFKVKDFIEIKKSKIIIVEHFLEF